VLSKGEIEKGSGEREIRVPVFEMTGKWLEEIGLQRPKKVNKTEVGYCRETSLAGTTL